MTAIPEEFLNVLYVEQKQENLDDFLSVRGVPWLVRKLISGKLKSSQFLLKIEGEGYRYTSGSPSNALHYSFKLDEPFTDIAYDGKKHKITISVEGNKLKETHLNLERDIGEDVFYFFFKDGLLVSECTAQKDGKIAVWKREYKRMH